MAKKDKKKSLLKQVGLHKRIWLSDKCRFFLSSERAPCVADSVMWPLSRLMFTVSIRQTIESILFSQICLLNMFSHLEGQQSVLARFWPNARCLMQVK